MEEIHFYRLYFKDRISHILLIAPRHQEDTIGTYILGRTMFNLYIRIS